jgi:uncharacterized protein (TIGR04255 family)
VSSRRGSLQFATDDDYELIQFQGDRLLHNWRKLANHANEYPRFDTIIGKFTGEIRRFEQFCSELQPQKLIIRQCELSYINHIRVAPGQLRVGEWLKFISFGEQEPDDFAATFRRTITSGDGQPRGRLICESATNLDLSGEAFIALTLTVRGIPERPETDSALEFITRGREMIVRTFADITTESAHKAWGRTQ